jgi:hypothetical protein
MNKELAATPLDHDQQVRAEALRIARSVLTNTSLVNSALAVSPTDLVDVAQYIVSGADPLAPYRQDSLAMDIP